MDYWEFLIQFLICIRKKMNGEIFPLFVRAWSCIINYMFSFENKSTNKPNPYSTHICEDKTMEDVTNNVYSKN